MERQWKAKRRWWKGRRRWRKGQIKAVEGQAKAVERPWNIKERQWKGSGRPSEGGGKSGVEPPGLDATDCVVSHCITVTTAQRGELDAIGSPNAQRQGSGRQKAVEAVATAVCLTLPAGADGLGDRQGVRADRAGPRPALRVVGVNMLC